MSCLPVAGRTLVVPLLAAMLTPLVVALSASPATAHNALTTSAPSDGASVTTAPSEVILAFEEAVDRRYVKIAVTGPGGTSVAAGGPAASGGTVRQPLGVLGSGRHVVSFRVVSQDGHPVQGTVTFTATLTASGPSAAPATPTPGAETTRSTTNEPSTRAVVNSRSYGAGWLPYAVLGAVVLGVAGVGFMLAGLRGSARGGPRAGKR